MKLNAVTIDSRYSENDFEDRIQNRNSVLHELAEKKGGHYGSMNRPMPGEDNLDPYIGEIIAAYEQLGSESYHWHQPQLHFPQAKMDSDHLKESEKQIDKQIEEQRHENSQAEYKLGNFHPGSLPFRAFLGVALSLSILSGEVFYNKKSFQLIVDNMLFALWLSIATSLAVLIGAHAAAYYYGKAKTKLQRRIIVIATLTIVSIVFYVISLFRSSYVSKQDHFITPGVFVVFNLFFFLVVTYLSLRFIPTWEDVKEQYHSLTLLRKLRKGKKEIKRLQDEIKNNKARNHNTEKERAAIIYNANYQAERIRKMCAEAISIFIGANLIRRTDNKVPDCFSRRFTQPVIQDIAITFVNQKERIQ